MHRTYIRLYNYKYMKIHTFHPRSSHHFYLLHYTSITIFHFPALLDVSSPHFENPSHLLSNHFLNPLSKNMWVTWESCYRPCRQFNLLVSYSVSQSWSQMAVSIHIFMHFKLHHLRLLFAKFIWRRGWMNEWVWVIGGTALTRTADVHTKKRFLCYFVHHKFYRHLPGIVPEPSHWERLTTIAIWRWSQFHTPAILPLGGETPAPFG